MLIDEERLQHWMHHFYGYGSWRAPFWFVSFEEGGGDLPEDVAERLNYFADTYGDTQEATLCDIRALYQHVGARVSGRNAGRFQNLYEYRFGDNAVLHTVWGNLAKFKHGFYGRDLFQPLEYQKNDFVSVNSHTDALIRLYPLPAPHNHSWYYSWLDLPRFPFLKTREKYEQHLYHDRITTVMRKIHSHTPKVVLMYGMKNINDLKSSVQKAFPGAIFKQVKAVMQQIPQHHFAELNQTKLIITTQIPALKHNRIESGFDWNAFGRSVGTSSKSTLH